MMRSMISVPTSLRACWANFKRLDSLRRLLSSRPDVAICGVGLRHVSDTSQMDKMATERNVEEVDTADLGLASANGGSEITAEREIQSSVPETTKHPIIQTSIQETQSEATNETRERPLSEDTLVSVSQAEPSRPRKEAPVQPDPENCCESGCINCVWIKYAEEVKDYYPDHKQRLKEIVDKIEDYNVKMFVKIELGLK